MSRIALVTTCRGRLNHLRQTLPQNLKDGKGAVTVVLDYNDQEGLGDYIQQEHQEDIEAGTLVYYRNDTEPRFRMAHAKNQAHRCAMVEGADILVTLDADNFTGPGFVDYVAHQFRGDPDLSFLSPDFKALPPRGHRFNPQNPLRLGRGFAGRIAIRAQDFIKVGGYNEIYDKWGSEDVCLIARLDRMKFKKGAIEPVFLNAIAHSSKVRFREYPEAEECENDDIYAITEKAHDTVLNNGQIGCGIVSRNFDGETISLDPMPTRIFGIGMQRTGTTSLHEAFKMLGFDSGHWKSGEWARAIWWEMNKWGRSKTLEQDYALTDNPIPILYEKLDKAYPGSKFILTVRDEDAWIRSIETFWTYEGNRHRWTWDIDGFSHKMHAIIYGVTEFDEQIFRERYRRHNAEVIRYFNGRSDFMVLDINERAHMSTLCRFLNVPVINKAFPHRNVTNGGANGLGAVGRSVAHSRHDQLPRLDEAPVSFRSGNSEGNCKDESGAEETEAPPTPTPETMAEAPPEAEKTTGEPNNTEGAQT